MLKAWNTFSQPPKDPSSLTRRRMVVVWIAGSATWRGLQFVYCGKSRPTLRSSQVDSTELAPPTKTVMTPIRCAGSDAQDSLSSRERSRFGHPADFLPFGELHQEGSLRLIQWC